MYDLKKDMKSLFEVNGFIMENIISNIRFRLGRVSFKNKLAFGIFEEFLSKQYYIVARKDK